MGELRPGSRCRLVVRHLCTRLWLGTLNLFFILCNCVLIINLPSQFYRKNQDVVSYLMNSGFSVNTRDAQGRTPLHIAAMNVAEHPDRHTKGILRLLLLNESCNPLILVIYFWFWKYFFVLSNWKILCYPFQLRTLTLVRSFTMGSRPNVFLLCKKF